MSAELLKENIYWVGVKNPELKVFDIIMETKKGTTYNSYLINDEKIAVIDTVKDGYFDEFYDNIKEVIGNKKIDYIIVQHTELDHSGSLSKLLETYPEALVIGTKAAIIYLKNIVNHEFNFKYAEGELSLGKNSLSFIPSPNLHWPDTMFTFMKSQNVIFTCDFLGCHYCPKGKITSSTNDDYEEEMKYYFDCIMGPFKKFVNMGLSKIENFKIDIAAPSHGPIHMNDTEKFIELYKTWAKVTEIKNKTEIFYISAYGNTGKMAEFFKEQLIKKGHMAEVTEITSENLGSLAKRVEEASSILVGSPTINQDAVKPAWDLLSLVCPITNRGKAAAAFGSFGWSGEGVPMLTERLKSLKLKVLDKGFSFNFVPSEEDYKRAEDFIDEFIKLL